MIEWYVQFKNFPVYNFSQFDARNLYQCVYLNLCSSAFMEVNTVCLWNLNLLVTKGSNIMHLNIIPLHNLISLVSGQSPLKSIRM